MYKALCAAALAAIVSYCCLHFSPALYQNYLFAGNITSSTIRDSTYNISEMALASVSRSVVKKVLSVETPEVRRPIVVVKTRLLT